MMKSIGNKVWGIIGASVGKQGTFSLALPGFSLNGCFSRVRLSGGALETVRWTITGIAGEQLRLAGETASGRWMMVISSSVNCRGVEGVRLEMSGRPNRGAEIAELIPFAMRRLPADHLLVQGSSAGGCDAIPLPAKQEQAFAGYYQTMITRKGVSLQMANPLRQDNPSTVSGRVKEGALVELAVVTPLSVGGRSVNAEPLMMYADPDGHALMEAWAEENREKMKSPALPVAGWNSWDYYRWTITEEAVLKNAEFIAADPVLRRHVKRIIIDDGWQYCYGEWDANPLFPHGMKWLARRLTALGFEPGIWMCPGVAEPHSRIAQWDTDMLAKGKSGLPCLAFNCMQRLGFVLDPTVPKTRRWIYELFDRYADMGFRYFKLDFLQQLLKAKVFADPSVPRGQLVRQLIEPAHRALKGRAQIMGCGYTFAAGTALVDEVRTSSDIHARWDCIQENSSSIAARWWAQGRLWGNDPDFALARGPETSNDPDLKRLLACLVFVKPENPDPGNGEYVLSTMSLNEARTLLSLVLISGGAVNLSDDLTKLNATGLDLVRRTVAAERGGAGVPLDLFSTHRSSRWVQPLWNGRRILLVNWTEKRREVSLDAGAEGLAGKGSDFWTGKPVTVRKGRVTAELPPHSCLLAEFRG